MSKFQSPFDYHVSISVLSIVYVSTNWFLFDVRERDFLSVLFSFLYRKFIFLNRIQLEPVGCTHCVHMAWEEVESAIHDWWSGCPDRALCLCQCLIKYVCVLFATNKRKETRNEFSPRKGIGLTYRLEGLIISELYLISMKRSTEYFYFFRQKRAFICEVRILYGSSSVDKYTSRFFFSTTITRKIPI